VYISLVRQGVVQTFVIQLPFVGLYITPCYHHDVIHSRVEEERMRQAVPITLGAEDRRQLQRQIHSHRSAVRLVERSKILLLAADGTPTKRAIWCRALIHIQSGDGASDMWREDTAAPASGISEGSDPD